MPSICTRPGTARFPTSVSAPGYVIRVCIRIPTPCNAIRPLAVMDYDIPMTVEQCRDKLREEFVKHRNVTDIRVIDMLVIKVNASIRELCCR